jgi:hypothetical protein
MHQSVYEGTTSFSPHNLPAQLLILPFLNPHPFLLSSLSFPGLGFGVGSGARCPRTWCSGVAVRAGRRGPASALDAPGPGAVARPHERDNDDLRHLSRATVPPRRLSLADDVCRRGGG